MCKCDWKRKVLVAVVLAVVYAGMDYFFHHHCLGSIYKETAAMWRPMEEIRSLMWMMYAGYLIFGFVFYCIFGFGFEATKSKGLQGLRYGVMVGILVWGVGNLLMVPFMPYPKELVWGWLAVGMFEYAILGVITGLLYKPKAG